MKTKDKLRKKFITLRKKEYFNVSNDKFKQLINYLKLKNKTKKNFFVALYYPSNYEIDILKILNVLEKTKITFLLPKILNRNSLKFFKWRRGDVLLVNKFGIPEPYNNSKSYHPDIVLVPLLAFDNNKNRLGYGKGFYDRYLNNLKKLNKKFEAIGIAFSFQKYRKIPTSKFDFRLKNIFTEKGFLL